MRKSEGRENPTEMGTQVTQHGYFCLKYVNYNNSYKNKQKRGGKKCLLVLGVGDSEAGRDDDLIAVHATKERSNDAVAVICAANVMIEDTEKDDRAHNDTAVRLGRRQVQGQMRASSHRRRHRSFGRWSSDT